MKMSELYQFLRARDDAGQWLLSRDDIRQAFPKESEHSFKKSLSRHIENGLLIDVARGWFAHPGARSRPDNIVQELLNTLRPPVNDSVNYVAYSSRDDVLMAEGVAAALRIAFSPKGTELPDAVYDVLARCQACDGEIKVMTTGKNGKFDTILGRIVFVRRNRRSDCLSDLVDYDEKNKRYVGVSKEVIDDRKLMRKLEARAKLRKKRMEERKKLKAKNAEAAA